MSESSKWTADPRLKVWKERVQIWQRTHSTSIPMPITQDEYDELESIYPAEYRFLIHTPEETIVVFGRKDSSQRFVVIENGADRQNS